MKLELRISDNYAAETIEIAGGMAWGAAKQYFLARDGQPPFSADDCRERAEDVYREWAGQEAGEDHCKRIADEILSRANIAGAAVYLDN